MFHIYLKNDFSGGFTNRPVLAELILVYATPEKITKTNFCILHFTKAKQKFYGNLIARYYTHLTKI